MKYIRKTAQYNGKRFKATGKTELEALQKLAEKLAAANRGEKVVGSSMAVDAWYRPLTSRYVWRQPHFGQTYPDFHRKLV